jgi:glutamate synthase domain-containing protein 1
MTLEEYNNNLRNLAARTEERLTERVVVVAATRMLASMQNRIFRDGQDSNGNRIGSYSTTPYYATQKQFVKKSAFKPAGKTGKGKFKSGQAHKAMFLKDGYKEFRDIQGRTTAEVNLQLKGDLKLSYALQAKDKEALIGFNDEKQSLKRKGLEEHFKSTTGTIFPATDQEKQEYSMEFINELKLVEGEIMNALS